MHFVKPFAREQASQTQKALVLKYAERSEGYYHTEKAFMTNDLTTSKGMTGSARESGKSCSNDIVAESGYFI
ncbi:hypothetical protein JN11_03946 [Mucilaginibacter frigoritolerans]|uniref:Uncharacterized protein n=1 Tax=Mucilaginibacter frigoritolerans TaxID=652788 RepID=A0A562TTK4_9SPHI|nr:hypothetical protein JN11_03946 [Mucilaginibacter frigoritolerans]